MHDIFCSNTDVTRNSLGWHVDPNNEQTIILLYIWKESLNVHWNDYISTYVSCLTFFSESRKKQFGLIHAKRLCECSCYSLFLLIRLFIFGGFMALPFWAMAACLFALTFVKRDFVQKESVSLAIYRRKYIAIFMHFLIKACYVCTILYDGM